MDQIGRDSSSRRFRLQQVAGRVSARTLSISQSRAPVPSTVWTACIRDQLCDPDTIGRSGSMGTMRRVGAHRLLFRRWMPPEQFVVAPESVGQLREEIRTSLRAFLSPAFPRLQVAITHVNERPDQARLVVWEWPTRKNQPSLALGAVAFEK